ncbi:LPO_1073/Vpar_1526 family protein [Actinoplanes siamensis]|uniref:Uncharacterized protein n=1 Tax=Actinoplanes siamensis TaxID=1223317 RepID=A0A919N8H9_9ACTN|nr:LPO_1073/Vpar_1526 family protein [Actinoplanes siamensis]GIF06255.1 hypothetical protein Asi03nite_37930 [Actinoplanes siamensis]
MIEPNSDNLHASGGRSVAAANISGVASTGDGAIIVSQQMFGISYSDARNIAMDVFKDNFERLKGDAIGLAQERAEKVTDEFLRKLHEMYPEAVKNFSQPGLQRSLYRVQEAAACSEERDLDEVLVNVLVERSKEEKASLKRVILDESLQTIPKLTAPQINSLSLIFSLRYTRIVAPPIESAAATLALSMTRYGAALGPIASSEMALQHLAYAGCLSISINQLRLGRSLAQNYPGVFSRRFDRNSIGPEIAAAFKEDPNDSALLYCPISDEESLSAYLDNMNMADQKEPIKNALHSNLLSDSEVEAKMIELQPTLQETFSLWNDSSLKHSELTSVGTAIGYTNLRLKTGFAAPLDIWISES